jgi:hypothetical protein
LGHSGHSHGQGCQQPQPATFVPAETYKHPKVQEANAAVEIKPFANMLAIKPITNTAAITKVRTATELFALFIV